MSISGLFQVHSRSRSFVENNSNCYDSCFSILHEPLLDDLFIDENRPLLSNFIYIVLELPREAILTIFKSIFYDLNMIDICKPARNFVCERRCPNHTLFLKSGVNI